MKSKIILVYKDIEDVPVERQGFELIGKQEITPQSRLVKETTMPGMFGHKDLFIRHLSTEELFVISYTHAEPSDAERAEIIEAAIKWLSEQN